MYIPHTQRFGENRNRLHVNNHVIKQVYKRINPHFLMCDQLNAQCNINYMPNTGAAWLS
jgi:hypothetical protein